MKNNVVFITAIESVLSASRSQAYKYSIESWKRWCVANGAVLRVLDEPLYDPEFMKPNYFRYFCHKLLEGEEYDQICLVDADTIAHPNCPNFFNLTQGSFTAVREDGDMDWVIRSIENYKHEFPTFFKKTFEIWDYFNSGFIVINKSHEALFDELTQFYLNNREKVQHYQKTYGTGTDQPLLNLIVQDEGIKVNFLPYQFNMTALQSKNILDERMLFTKIPGIYHFNAVQGGPNMVNFWMQKTFEYFYGKY